MTTDPLAHLKFPIGPFVINENMDASELERNISTVASAPGKYKALAEQLTSGDLSLTYRDGSWNVQQLFNHVADMQLLHFFRMKRALTETDYKEVTLVNIDGWAHSADGLTSSINDSLQMFEGITHRYVHLMRSLDKPQLAKSYYHPIRKIMLDQKQAIAMSAWHVQHHAEHIKIALKNR